MISKILLTGLMAFFLSAGISELAEDRSTTTEATSIPINGEVMKAIIHNGEIIPYVELPTVEISAKRNVSDLVKATIIDGEVYPLIELDEVVITPIPEA